MLLFRPCLPTSCALLGCTRPDHPRERAGLPPAAPPPAVAEGRAVPPVRVQSHLAHAGSGPRGVPLPPVRLPLLRDDRDALRQDADPACEVAAGHRALQARDRMLTVKRILRVLSNRNSDHPTRCISESEVLPANGATLPSLGHAQTAGDSPPAPPPSCWFSALLAPSPRPERANAHPRIGRSLSEDSGVRKVFVIGPRL